MTMKKRRAKRQLEVSKRCRCTNRATCSHHWFLRVRVNGLRQRIDLTAMFPGEDVNVAAAKAKLLVQQGTLHSAHVPTTFSEVADRYIAAYPKRHHYYVEGLRAAL